ncbi:MAG TPA: purine-nucleoside phosphorylase [Mollicutes bacterium]|jgi:purine-nucleoside phosphorylase|nr:purine-nucleoside phosphorylase [Mollicutes bacterium]
MATAHISADKGDIAKTVLMPGDPLRAKFIADNYLTDVVMFNKVRNMFGYTGYYNGKKVSVMGSGMGMPSMGIYSYELFKEYDVDRIIRIGSCGALIPELKLFDLILTTASYSDSSYAYVQSGEESNILKPALSLNNHIEKVAKNEEIKLTKGIIYSTDVFYKENMTFDKIVNEYKCIGTEMESFALFHNANLFNKEAACLLTVSDSLVTKEFTTSEQREKAFLEMIDLALKTL